MVCFSSLSKVRCKDMDMDMMTIIHAVDHKRKVEMLHQHRALRMLANNSQADQEHSHAMSTAQDTVSQ